MMICYTCRMRDEFQHNGFHCTRWWGEEANSGTLFCRIHSVKSSDDVTKLIFDTEASFGENYVEFKLKENDPLEYLKSYVTEEAMRKIDVGEYKDTKDVRMLN